MGCVTSKLEEEEQVVSICRERTRQLKLAVERRHDLAEAHYRYCQALYAVSAAINLFVTRHSSPPSPFLITFPPPCHPPSPSKENRVIMNPLFLQQTLSQPTHKTVSACHSCSSSTSSVEEGEEEGKAREEQAVFSDYSYMQMRQPVPSPARDFGWDFFNPFETMRPETVSGYFWSFDDHLSVVRREEGIPELEEEGDQREEEEKEEEEEEAKEDQRVVEEAVEGNDEASKEKGVSVIIDTPEEGRELLEVLKDIEDNFVRAYDSGQVVSKMLEANRIQMLSGLDEIKENSTKLIQAITWPRSSSAKPSSCKSLVASSSSKSSSAWTEFNNGLFDDYGGMDSGSHSSTLERLYAWEKKLYEEVKTGDGTRKIYEKRCSRLKDIDVKGDDELTLDKTRATIKDLYARILVAIRSAESISKRVEKLRDEELQPQVVELLKGLTQTWKIMLQSHETQKQILVKVKNFSCPSYGKFCNESHRLATLQLMAELQNWCACFTKYVTAQKVYVDALHGWLTKFLVPEVEFYSRGSTSSSALYRLSGPSLLVICHDWLASMDKLPDKAVAFALKSFAKDVRTLWVQQGEEQQQKRRVDNLAKELDRRTLGFQKIENRFFESKLMENESEPQAECRSEYLAEKKDELDMFRRKLEAEKDKHLNCMEETQRIILNGFQTGFSGVFESLTEFAKASQKMYSELVECSENIEKARNLGFIEGGQVEENVGR